MIVTLSNTEDIHAKRVQQELEKLGAENVILDLSVPLKDIQISATPEGIRLLRTGNKSFQLGQIRAVWARRPSYPKLRSKYIDVENRRFVNGEWKEVIKLIEVLEIPFVSKIDAQINATKPIQLQLAEAIGLRVPDTVITNVPEIVGEFIERHKGKVIHKTMKGHQNAFLKTEKWSDSYRKYLEYIKVNPVVFQEEIEAQQHIRVTVIGDDLYSASIKEQKGEVDSRLYRDMKYQIYQLPEHIEAKLRLLMRKLELQFGTIDVLLTRDGEHIFLEINPQGQFLYIEILTGIPLCEIFARYLAKLSG